MEYLLFLTPGILAFFIYNKINTSIPKEKIDIHLVSKYVVLTFLSSGIMFIFIIFISDKVKWADSPTETYYSLLNEVSSLIYMCSLILGVVSTLLVLFGSDILIPKLFNKTKNPGTTVGSLSYTKYLKEAILYTASDGTTYTRPIKFYHDNVLIEGQFRSKYKIPWEFKEIFVNTREDLTDSFKKKPIYVYYDIEHKIKIEVYDF